MTKHKRVHGSGSIYLRDTGDRSKGYVGALQLPSGDTRYVSGRTKIEVSDKLDGLRRELGIVSATGSETVAEFAAMWLKHLVGPAKARNSLALYESTCRLHILPSLGRVRLRKLSAMAVQQFLAGRLAEGCSPSHLSTIKAVLSAMLGRAVQWRYISINPARATEIPPVPEHEGHPLTPEEFPRFMTAIAGDRFETLYLTMLGTGLRIGETLGLTWGDVDLDTGRLEVRHQLDRVDGGLALTRLKRPKSCRTVMVTDFALEPLRVMRGEREGEGDTNLIFTGPNGALREATVRANMERICREGGLPPLTPHDLRRTYASLLETEGVDPRTLQELMGHSSPIITLGLYARSHQGAKSDAAARLDRLAAQKSHSIADRLLTGSDTQSDNEN